MPGPYHQAVVARNPVDSMNCGLKPHRMWLVLTVTLPMVSGCHKVLFPQTEPRTQFEKTDALRDRFTPVQEPDVFGNPKPALRARLSPPS
jgi:hypothetical protein